MCNLRVECRIRNVGTFLEGTIDGSTECKVTGITVDLPFDIIAGCPETKVQCVNQEYPVECIRVGWLGMVLVLREILDVNLFCLQANDYLGLVYNYLYLVNRCVYLRNLPL